MEKSQDHVLTLTDQGLLCMHSQEQVTDTKRLFSYQGVQLLIRLTLVFVV